jgi:hypothetical protein
MASIKLNERSLNILKNFSSINPSIVFKPGQELTTVSIGRKILAKATIEQTIDSTFGIYELNKFFGAISLFKDPSIRLEKSFLKIGEGGRSLLYSTANPSDIKSPDDDMPWDLPSSDVEFAVSGDMLKSMLKAAGVLSQPHIVFEGDGSTVTMSTRNMDKPTSETYSEDVGEFNGGETPFKVVLKVENLKLLPGNYLVKISKIMITQFIGDDVTYIIAVEAKDSTF